MSETTFDFGNGPVPATRLDNGAWIAASATVATSAFVGRGARVATSAIVGVGAIVGPGAYVGERAFVGRGARVATSAIVGVGAIVGPGAYVGERAHVGDGAYVGDAAIVGPGAYVGPRAHVGDGAYVGDAGTIAWGRVLSYDWTAYCVDGEVVLRYGCEVHPLAEWTRARRWRLARTHVPAKAKEYAHATRALVRLVRATVKPNGLPAAQAARKE